MKSNSVFIFPIKLNVDKFGVLLWIFRRDIPIKVFMRQQSLTTQDIYWKMKKVIRFQTTSCLSISSFSSKNESTNVSESFSLFAEKNTIFENGLKIFWRGEGETNEIWIL